MDDASSFPMDGPNSDMGPMNQGFDDSMDAPISDGPMDNTPMEPEQDPLSKEDSELLDLINKLNIEDKAAAKKYIQSMVDDSEDDGGEFDMDAPNMGGEESPMMEGLIVTKEQLKRLNEKLRR